MSIIFTLLTENYYLLSADKESYIFQKFNPPAQEIIILSTINNKPVTSIAKFAFYDCTIVTKVTFPNTITEIDDFAFSGCRSLKNINIPDSVTYIGEQAFRNCRKLTSIVIPKNVENIGKDAFMGCVSLRKIYYKGSRSDWNKIAMDRWYRDTLKDLVDDEELKIIYNHKG